MAEPFQHHLTVAPEQDGMRLDRFLAQGAIELSRTRLKSLIENEQVRLRGSVVTVPNARVKPGDEIVILIPAPTQMTLEPEAIALDIRHEDDDLIVLMKPAGMVVHPAPGHYQGTLVHALLAHCGESLSGIGGVQRPGIVHRIDKDVSGLLVIAKHDKAHMGLAGQFTVHSVDRQYDAIVHGVPNKPNDRIEKPIGRHPKDRKRQAIVASGKHAITDYKLIAAADVISHVRCTLHTGRTHQIRVHLASLNHNILGDPIYHPRRRPKWPEPLVAIVTDLDRIALHAARIGFDHPIHGRRMQFEAPMPPVFAKMLEAGKN